ncbi:MAG: thioredoxin family protein [Candidatus Heimdallarchaeota archaeon]|nr:thioredoxin family protein [Candidatus Heimdallarchaeota archaeon]MCK4955392.1 thioredoxin family protein [Candidatus Heimdallarchaeota archaeon]
MYGMKEIILYTAEDCPYCNIAERILKTVLEEYDGLFNYKNVKINKKNHQLNVSSIPTILVGKTKIEGLPEKEQIHTALFS